MTFSYVDIFILACAAIGLFFGLFGKLPRKIWRLILVAGSIVLAYFTYNILIDTALALEPSMVGLQSTEATIKDYVMSILANIDLGGNNLDLTSLWGLAYGVAGLVVFWVETLILMLVTRILLGWFAFVFCGKKRKKHTAICSLGLVGAVKGALVGVVLILPFIVLSPVLANSKDLIESVDQIITAMSSQGGDDDQSADPAAFNLDDSSAMFVDDAGSPQSSSSSGSIMASLAPYMEYIELASNSFQSSKAIEWTMAANDAVKFSFLEYKNDDGDDAASLSIVDDLKSISNAVIEAGPALAEAFPNGFSTDALFELSSEASTKLKGVINNVFSFGPIQAIAPQLTTIAKSAITESNPQIAALLDYLDIDADSLNGDLSGLIDLVANHGTLIKKFTSSQDVLATVFGLTHDELEEIQTAIGELFALSIIDDIIPHVGQIIASLGDQLSPEIKTILNGLDLSATTLGEDLSDLVGIFDDHGTLIGKFASADDKLATLTALTDAEKEEVKDAIETIYDLHIVAPVLSNVGELVAMLMGDSADPMVASIVSSIDFSSASFVDDLFSLLNSASSVLGGLIGGQGEPDIAVLLEDPQALTDILTNPILADALPQVIESVVDTIPGIDDSTKELLKDIDMAAEAESIAAVANFVSFNDGEMSLNTEISAEGVDAVLEAVETSDLLNNLGDILGSFTGSDEPQPEMGSGTMIIYMLAGSDEGAAEQAEELISTFTDAIGEKYDAESEEYARLMAFFGR